MLVLVAPLLYITPSPRWGCQLIRPLRTYLLKLFAISGNFYVPSINSTTAAPAHNPHTTHGVERGGRETRPDWTMNLNSTSTTKIPFPDRTKQQNTTDSVTNCTAPGRLNNCKACHGWPAAPTAPGSASWPPQNNTNIVYDGDLGLGRCCVARDWTRLAF